MYDHRIKIVALLFVFGAMNFCIVIVALYAMGYPLK